MNAKDYKLVLIVLPDTEVDESHLNRVHQALKYRFPKLQVVDICVRDEYLIKRQNTLKNLKIIGFSDTKFWEYPIAVIVLDEDGNGTGYDKIDFNHCRVYEADKWCMLRYAFRGLDEVEYPHVNTHIFNKLSAGLGNERMTYFPFGYSTQYAGLGPIDEFGHRINGKISQYSNREPNHILITVFGGSAAWSTHTLYDEMFSALLEQKLNNYCLDSGVDLKFSVLNFSQPSAVTLNNLITYMLFCFDIKPDIVLAHCGVNDMAFGQTSDRYLLSEHKIAYQFQLEQWAEILASGNQVGNDDLNWEKLPILTYPRQILKAFSFRVKQFEQIVVKGGGHFIVGLQPTIYSKTELSVEEIRWKKDSESKYWSHVLKNISFLYSELLIKFPNIDCDNFINVHEKFSECEPGLTHFCDALHSSPLGDQLTSDIYFKYIVDNLLGKLQVHEK